ncbi:hypothetical protein [Roseateles sp. P5_E7]
MKALFTAIAAVVLATSASAGTVTISNFTHQDDTGFGKAFDDTYTLTLASDTWVGGLLNTVAPLGGDPAVDVQSVTLRRLGSNASWAETVAIDWDTAFSGVEQWALSTRLLSAGEWQLEITGVSYSDKTANGYSAALELPEPGSVALATLALLGAGVTSIRRRKA